jgi:hypothetical protein
LVTYGDLNLLDSTANNSFLWGMPVSKRKERIKGYVESSYKKNLELVKGLKSSQALKSPNTKRLIEYFIK